MSAAKLQLKSSMGRSYLIQRLEKPRGQAAIAYTFGAGKGGLTRSWNELLSGVLTFDYMGNAHFEFGEVPAALDFLREQAGHNNLTSGRHLDVCYLCPKRYEPGVKTLLEGLLADEYSLHLAERCGLREALVRPRDIVGWLEINNGFFFFVDEEMFQKTKRLFGVR